MKQNRKTALALAVAAAMQVHGATAQTDTGGATGATADNATASGGGLERIVVTANRRDQLVQDTPLAVSAFTQDTLQNNQVKDLASLTSLVPSLVVEPHSDSGACTCTCAVSAPRITRSWATRPSRSMSMASICRVPRARRR